MRNLYTDTIIFNLPIVGHIDGTKLVDRIMYCIKRDKVIVFTNEAKRINRVMFPIRTVL